jgi:hypothetical protein
MFDAEKSSFSICLIIIDAQGPAAKNNAWVIMGYINYIILNPHMLLLKYK